MFTWGNTHIKHFFKFCLVGAAAVSVFIFLYQYFLTLDLSGIVANIFAYIGSITVGYYLNSRYTFKSKIKLLFLYKYLAVNIFSLALNSMVYFMTYHLLIDNSHNLWIAAFFAISISTLSNFIGLKKYVFS